MSAHTLVRLRGLAVLATLAVILAAAPVGALQLTAGPVGDIPGGYENRRENLDPSCNDPNACTGITQTYIVRTPGAFADLYWGLNNTYPAPQVTGAALDGVLNFQDTGTFRYASSTPRSITYTSRTTIHSASLGVVNVNNRLVMTLVAGTGVVVDTQGTPANNAYADVQKLFKITSNSFSVRIEVTSNALPRAVIDGDTLIRGTFRPTVELFNSFDFTPSTTRPHVSVHTGFYYLLCTP
jgi:hypothetical protein